jgi:hypothetical protein
MANDCIKIKEEGDAITCEATAAVTGKKFVYVSGPRTSGGIGATGTVPAGSVGAGLVADATVDKSAVYKAQNTGAGQAAKRQLGVAAFDAPLGGLFTVLREGILPITCSAAITGGQEVEVASGGTVIPLAAGIAVGLAMDTQATVGADAEILLYNS